MSHADTIKSLVSAKDFLMHYGIQINRAGFCQCLFHDDHNASMKVYDGRRGFFCFTCHKGGTVIDLAMQYHSCDFQTALRLLNDDFSLGLDIDGRFDFRKREEQLKQQELKRLRMWLDEQCRKVREEEFWTAFDQWYDNEKVIADNRPDPQHPGDEWNELFQIALNKRCQLYENLMNAEERRKKSYGQD